MGSEDSFFSRWSRRKAEAQPRQVLTQSASTPSAAGAVAQPPQTAHPRSDSTTADPAGRNAAPVPEGATAESAAASPTLADVAALTPDADFSRFVARNVSAQVRNAAVKKLFADPHFNVMDGLDIYIDDYSIPSPLEPELVAQMHAMQFLEQAREAERLPAHPSADPSPEREGERLAEPATEPETPQADEALPNDRSPTDQPPDDHPHLQLQPDPAAGPGGPEPGPG